MNILGAVCRRVLLWYILIVIVVSGPYTAWAETPGSEAAPAAAPTSNSNPVAAPIVAPLKHGVNLVDWFTGAQRETLSPRDFAGIKMAGFDHVRIAVNPDLLGFSLGDASNGRVLFDFQKLDQAIDMAQDANLTVIVDLEPTEGIMSLIEQDSRSQAGMIALWTRVAEHLKVRPTGQVWLELLNQPPFRDDVERYRSLVSDGVAAIRQVAPDLTIVVDVPRGAVVDGFDGFAPLGDQKTIYAFQFFEPFIFTHQGVRLGAEHGRALRYFRNVPYPSALVDSKVDYAPNASDVLEAKKELSEYLLANWDSGHISARIKQAAAWATAKHRSIICVAFGAIRKSTSPGPRYLWMEHVRRSLDANGIAWDVSDYAGAFGITKLTGQTISDPTDGTTRLADPDTGSRDIEYEAQDSLFRN